MPTRRYDLVIEGRSYHVDVERSGSHAARVTVDGKSYDVDIASAAPVAVSPAAAARPAPAAPPPAASPAHASGTGDVRAPMPGLILDVLVQVGAHVSAGDTVVRLEAMKMENNLITTVSGTVRAVHVAKGAEVVNHHLLVEIDPE